MNHNLTEPEYQDKEEVVPAAITTITNDESSATISIIPIDIG